MNVSSISEAMQPTLRERLKRASINKIETLEPEVPTFAITTRSRISTQDPPFPAPPQPATHNFTKEGTKKEGPEGAELSNTQEPAPRPSIIYQPSKTSNLPFPSRLKKQKKDDEDEQLLSIFKQIHINLSFLEAMIHMPKGAKDLKDLLSHKEKLETTASLVKLILEMDEEKLVLIFLGWPFLTTIRAVINELPEHLNYAFLQENNKLPVVISSALTTDKKTRLLEVLQNPKREISWSITDIKGIDSSFYTHKILMEDELKPTVQPQRRVNPNIKVVVKKEVIKLLDAWLLTESYERVWPEMRRTNPSTMSQQTIRRTSWHRHHNKKSLRSRFYWPHIFRDTRKLVQVYDACPRGGNISSRDETP
nr:hypothetical protein [Tanacetum cinerariifolium]